MRDALTRTASRLSPAAAVSSKGNERLRLKEFNRQQSISSFQLPLARRFSDIANDE